MTTFTTEDRILAEKDGSFTINVKGGTVTIGIKDLTDDEIRDICTKYLAPKDCNIFTFARAILKKARE
jgi:methyl coenzyme M reductase subunit D